MEANDSLCKHKKASEVNKVTSTYTLTQLHTMQLFSDYIVSV